MLVYAEARKRLPSPIRTPRGRSYTGFRSDGNVFLPQRVYRLHSYEFIILDHVNKDCAFCDCQRPVEEQRKELSAPLTFASYVRAKSAVKGKGKVEK